MNKLFLGTMDLHNHTQFSDGDLTLDEIIGNAINTQISIIGLSDHFEKIKDFNCYIDALNIATSQYKDSIRVWKGIEIEVTTFMKLLDEECLSFKELDFILIEDCEHYKSLSEFLVYAQEFIPRFSLRFGLAHIDFSKFVQRFGIVGLTELLAFMQQNKVFWEINSNFHNEFYDRLLYDEGSEILEILNLIKNYNLDLSIGSDTHCLEKNYLSRLERAHQVVDRLAISAKNFA